MAKTKEKGTTEPRQKSKPIDTPHSQSVDEINAIWNAEIETLKKQSFSDDEQAVDFIVARVSDRLSGVIPPTDEQKEFVKELILSNPLILAQIRGCLK